MKTKHDTPKYGLIYHASLIGQATGKNKGKMARVLAAKASLGLRVDALAEWDDDATEEDKSALGTEARYNLERKLAGMEGKPIKPRGVAIAPNGAAVQPKKFELNEARKYNADADALDSDEPASTKKSKGDKKLIEEVQDEEMADAGEEESDDDSDSDSGKKKSKKSKDPELEKAAEKAGLSVKRYQRKLERGEITFDAEGNPTAVSKKDLKKSKKESKKSSKDDDEKKRKRKDESEAADDGEKKKKKKRKSDA